jgi:hypothetical protein
MSRILPRLVTCVCLGVYLLANTHAAFALERIVSSKIAIKATTGPVDDDKDHSPPPTKCKHCKAKKPSEAHTPRNSDNSRKTSDDSTCPCCPDDHDGQQSPCPGCAICSVAKLPLLTPIEVGLDSWAICMDECQIEESFDYVSPLQCGLIRPPRLSLRDTREPA